MSIPRPKFCVGEYVDLRSPFKSQECVEITGMKYYERKKGTLADDTKIFYTGWAYDLSCSDEFRAREKYLRKRPITTGKTAYGNRRK